MTGFSRFVSTAFALAVTVILLTGCVSSSSNTATYGGPSIASTSAQLRTAKSETRRAKRELSAERRDLKALERKARRKAGPTKARRALRRQIRAAKKDVRSAERKLARAERAERRAQRDVKAARKRQKDAERRLAAAKREQAEERRRRAAADKKKSQEEAQAAIARTDSSSAFGAGLFSSSDPALKNVADYQARVDNAFPISAIPVDKLNKRLLRQEVTYRSPHKRGTVVVDTSAKYLYVVESSSRAMRYGIGVGREGFAWSGTAHIGFKRQWPTWTPPVEMIERQPELAKYCADCGGMPGGPNNPLGARALYLVKDGKDTLYRLHGTPQWKSIGTAASSGCIRLINQDVIDLYNRVPTGSKVIVL